MVLLQHIEQRMYPLSRCYNPTTFYSTTMGRFSATKSKTESKQVAAKKHSDAERRRRLRINSQFATLRTILPNLVKQDKAFVLGETVKYFNELKKMVKDITTTPSLEDSLRFGHCKNRDLTRVVFSCNDREGLMSEVAESMKAAKAKTVRVEMVTIGGRIKCALFVQGVNGNEGLVRLKKHLKPLVSNSKSSPIVENNKTGRYFFRQ